MIMPNNHATAPHRRPDPHCDDVSAAQRQRIHRLRDAVHHGLYPTDPIVIAQALLAAGHALEHASKN